MDGILALAAAKSYAKKYTDEAIAQIEAARVITKTTAEWQQDISFRPGQGVICIYSDYQQIEDEHGETQNVPGIKIGDGNAYIVDLPFIDAQIQEHITNDLIHVTSEEKEVWNNKLNYSDEHIDKEILILNRN